MKKMIKWIAKTLLITILTITGLFYLINSTIVVCRVEGSSMSPTFETGDKGYAFKGSVNKIERFDIVVIEAKDNYMIIKRVIGLPNETIEYKDNKLYVNGEYLSEEFLPSSVWTYDYSITLGDDEYFCLGDNREQSMDSRSYGAFNKNQIIASDFKLVENRK